MRQEKLRELEAIRAEAGGMLRAQDVVERARDPLSVLHGDFEWNDSAAAEAHRINQARGLIRAAVVILPAGNRGPVQVRAYVSLQPDRTDRIGYRHITDVLDDEAAAEQAASQLVDDVRRMMTRYAAFASLRPTLDDIEAAIGDLLPARAA